MPIIAIFTGGLYVQVPISCCGRKRIAANILHYTFTLLSH